MIDGLMAVENHLGTATGVMFNEFPDRLEDSIILVSAGFACSVQPVAAHLGWLAALLAVLTAYIRAFGGSLGQPQNFCGPMAKPHRMAAITIALVAGSAEFWFHQTTYTLLVALVVICLGAAATCVRRALSIAHILQTQKQ
jgi:phosphatidylglycerophosphate synthase